MGETIDSFIHEGTWIPIEGYLSQWSKFYFNKITIFPSAILSREANRKALKLFLFIKTTRACEAIHLDDGTKFQL